jgi:hypothetical protein
MLNLTFRQQTGNFGVQSIDFLAKIIQVAHELPVADLNLLDAVGQEFARYCVRSFVAKYAVRAPYPPDIGENRSDPPGIESDTCQSLNFRELASEVAHYWILPVNWRRSQMNGVKIPIRRAALDIAVSPVGVTS